MARKSPSTSGTKYLLVLFGDSLTDTGNTLRAAGVPDPKVYHGPNGTYTGRFTDGPNWVDYLNATLTKKHQVQILNYAYGGAMACPNAAFAAAFPFSKDLTSQTNDFIADVKAGKVVVDATTKVLVVQWIGANDVLFVLKQVFATGVQPTEAQLAALLQSTVTCRAANAMTLSQLTGVVSDIVLVPLSPIHIAPYLPDALKSQFKALEKAFGQATTAAVQLVQATLDSIPAGAPGHGVKVYSIGEGSNWLARNAVKVQPPFKYLDVPCFVHPTTSLMLTPNVTTCADPDDYLFYDDAHVSTRYHEWFALKGLLPRLQKLSLLPKKV